MKRLYTPGKGPMRIAAFMSGTGSNLRKILEMEKKMQNLGKSVSEIVMIFSDTPNSNAGEIAAENGISYYSRDIREYYRSRGAGSSRKDMKIREEYDRETVKLLKRHKIDVVILCGYMSLVSGEICDRYVTLNVHPADLRILDANGKRAFAGCIGAACIKKVVSGGYRETRASTHVVTKDVDNGPVLMVSDPIKLEFKEGENLNEFARKHQQVLKEKGDWKIYPETVKRVGLGRFWIDEEKNFAIDVFEEKAILRSRMKESRNKMSDAEVRDKSRSIVRKLAGLEEYANADVVMFYMASVSEVQTREAIWGALEAGKTVLLPLTDLAGEKIDPARLDSLENVKEGPFGIMEPAERYIFDLNEINLVIVPGLCFDDTGNRIGYGFGYYDKFLSNVSAMKVALSYESQVVDRVLTEPHDVAVDKIITESRVIECNKRLRVKAQEGVKEKNRTKTSEKLWG